MTTKTTTDVRVSGIEWDGAHVQEDTREEFENLPKTVLLSFPNTGGYDRGIGAEQFMRALVFDELARRFSWFPKTFRFEWK